jgi:hypothetical protein
MTTPQVPMRIETNRPGRVTRTILFVGAALGSLSFVITFFVLPTFSVMFAEFGADLPWATNFVVSARPAYPVSALISISAAYFLLYRTNQGSRSVLLVLGLLAVQYFVVVMSLAALFMPIFKLGAVAAK